MKKHLIFICALFVAISSSNAEDVFERVDREMREWNARAELQLQEVRGDPKRTTKPVLLHEFVEDDGWEEYEDERDTYKEADYRADLCSGMRQEVQLANGARADCLSDTHAIEVDFTEKWAEALGQSLLYAAATDLKPGIFLICRDKEANCLSHRLRLDEAISAFGLPITVWSFGEG